MNNRDGRAVARKDCRSERPTIFGRVTTLGRSGRIPDGQDLSARPPKCTRFCGMDIPKDSVVEYELALKRDKLLLVVHDETSEVKKARDILASTRPINVTLHSPEAGLAIRAQEGDIGLSMSSISTTRPGPSATWQFKPAAGWRQKC